MNAPTPLGTRHFDMPTTLPCDSDAPFITESLDVTSSASRHQDVPKSRDITGGDCAHGGLCSRFISTLITSLLRPCRERARTLLIAMHIKGEDCHAFLYDRTIHAARAE